MPGAKHIDDSRLIDTVITLMELGVESSIVNLLTTELMERGIEGAAISAALHASAAKRAVRTQQQIDAIAAKRAEEEEAIAAKRAEEEEQIRARDNARVNAACRQLDEEQHRWKNAITLARLEQDRLISEFASGMEEYHKAKERRKQLDEIRERRERRVFDFSSYEPPSYPVMLMDAQPLVRELFAQQISNLLDTPPRREFVLYCDVCGRKTSPRVHESCILCLRCLKLTLKNRRHGDPAFHAMMLERRRDKVLSKRIATTATHPWKGKRCP